MMNIQPHSDDSDVIETVQCEGMYGAGTGKQLYIHMFWYSTSSVSKPSLNTERVLGPSVSLAVLSEVTKHLQAPGQLSVDTVEVSGSSRRCLTQPAPPPRVGEGWRGGGGGGAH